MKIVYSVKQWTHDVDAMRAGVRDCWELEEERIFSNLQSALDYVNYRQEEFSNGCQYEEAWEENWDGSSFELHGDLAGDWLEISEYEVED